MSFIGTFFFLKPQYAFSVVQAHIVYTSISMCPQSLLSPQRIQMFNDREIRIQEPVHAVRSACLLALVQLSAFDRASNAFLPADICEGMYGYEL